MTPRERRIVDEVLAHLRGLVGACGCEHCERAAILEHDAGMPRAAAEQRAAEDAAGLLRQGRLFGGG